MSIKQRKTESVKNDHGKYRLHPHPQKKKTPIELKINKLMENITFYLSCLLFIFVCFLYSLHFQYFLFINI